MDSTPFEQALAARHAEQFEDKLVIARRVAEELPQDGVVVLDSGSLTFFCAQAMPKDTALAVVTNNLPAAQYLADYENLRVFTLPGTIRGLTSAAVDVWTTHRRERDDADARADDDEPRRGGHQASHAALRPTAGGTGDLLQNRPKLLLHLRRRQ
jgi:DeoR family fructose operon transcriptional repressor